MSTERVVHKPIFIIGSGRSGTTILYELLSAHPDLAWITNLTDTYPTLPFLSLLSNGPLKRINGYFGPSGEAINVYDYCGITRPIYDEKRALRASDLTSTMESRLRGIIVSHLKYMNKKRFVSKNTLNVARISFLRDVFPDAKFIHIVRNACAVASSLSRVAWWEGLNIWWCGKTPKQWVSEGGDPFELCARHWCRQVSEVVSQKAQISKENFYEIKYEELASNKLSTINKIARYLELDYTEHYNEIVSSIFVSSKSIDKWADEISSKDQETIKFHAKSMMKYYGYT